MIKIKTLLGVMYSRTELHSALLTDSRYKVDWVYRNHVGSSVSSDDFDILFRVRKLPLTLYAEARTKGAAVKFNDRVFLTKAFIIKRVPERCVDYSTRAYFTIWQMCHWYWNILKRKIKGY